MKSGLDARHQWKTTWVLDRLDPQVDIEIGPMKVSRSLSVVIRNHVSANLESVLRVPAITLDAEDDYELRPIF